MWHKIFTRPHGVVLSSTIGISVGITSTIATVFGMFLIPISEEFGLPRSSISAVYPILAVTSALIYPVIGRWADQFGSRIVILIGTISFVAYIATVSIVQGLVQFYLIFAMIGLTGSVLGPILFTKVIAGWFNKNPGFYLGMVSGVGNGTGSTVMPLIVVILLASFGWRGTFQSISLIILLFGLPFLIFFFRDPPKTPIPVEEDDFHVLSDNISDVKNVTFQDARKTKEFWMVLIAIPLCAGCMMAAFTHIVPILLDRGMPLGKATTVLSTFALVTIAGQIFAGSLLDRTNNPRIVTPLFAIAVIGVFLLYISTSYTGLLLSASLMGIGLGTEFGLLPYSISRYFGLKSYGVISGVMYSVVAITTGFLPMLMDVVFDIFGSYDYATIGLMVGLFIGTIIIARLPPYHIEKTAEKVVKDQPEPVVSEGL